MSCARPSAVSPTAQIPAACSPPPGGLQVLAFVPVTAESSGKASMPRWAVGATRRLQLVLETPGLVDVGPRVCTESGGPSWLPGEEAPLDGIRRLWSRGGKACAQPGTLTQLVRTGSKVQLRGKMMGESLGHHGIWCGPFCTAPRLAGVFCSAAINSKMYPRVFFVKEPQCKLGLEVIALHRY